MAMFAQYTPTTGYHSVAFSGNYNELNNLPPLGTVSPLNLNGATSMFLRGDGTWAIPVDVNAEWGNISGNINAQTDLIALLNLKAPITKPVFQGNPQAPTPPVDDNSKSLATTAWFFGQAFNGTPQMDGVASSGNSTLWARGNHRHPSDDTKIGDAPTDGQQYARQSQAWTVVASAGAAGVVVSGSVTCRPATRRPTPSGGPPRRCSCLFGTTTATVPSGSTPMPSQTPPRGHGCCRTALSRHRGSRGRASRDWGGIAMLPAFVLSQNLDSASRHWTRVSRQLPISVFQPKLRVSARSACRVSHRGLPIQIP